MRNFKFFLTLALFASSLALFSCSNKAEEEARMKFITDSLTADSIMKATMDSLRLDSIATAVADSLLQDSINAAIGATGAVRTVSKPKPTPVAKPTPTGPTGFNKGDKGTTTGTPSGFTKGDKGSTTTGDKKAPSGFTKGKKGK